MIIEEKIHHALLENNLTLSTAESCTGGAVATRLTRFPGASRYFIGSVVCYSDRLKIKLLGVPSAMIEVHGAVSEAVVRRMAQGMLDIAESDYSLAITGIAGPGGGTSEKPVGTVWCAVGRREHPPSVWKLQLQGTREEIISRSGDAVLLALSELLPKKIL